MNAVFLFVFSKHWYSYVVGGHKQEAPVHNNVVQYNNLIKTLLLYVFVEVTGRFFSSVLISKPWFERVV